MPRYSPARADRTSPAAADDRYAPAGRGARRSPVWIVAEGLLIYLGEPEVTGRPRQSLYIEARVDPATIERGGSRSVVQARLTRAGVEQPLP